MLVKRKKEFIVFTNNFNEARDKWLGNIIQIEISNSRRLNRIPGYHDFRKRDDYCYVYLQRIKSIIIYKRFKSLD